MKKSILPFFCVLALVGACRTAGEELSILSYNVQNLFDAVDDGGEYREFRVTNGLWDEGRYHAKLEAIGNTIGAVDPPPAVIVLQEVESRAVVDTLMETYVRRGEYTTVAAYESPGSATQVVVATRLPVLDIRTHVISGERTAGLRPIVEVHIRSDDGVFALFANHWKSRRGGVAETEPLRRLAASLVAGRIRALETEGAADGFFVVGDLNTVADPPEAIGLVPALSAADASGYPASPGAPIVVAGNNLAAATSSPAATVLVDPWLTTPQPGSYAFSGRWERIDKILYRLGQLTEPGGTGMPYTPLFEVLRPAELCRADGTPRPFDADTRSGYSDHFPVWLRFLDTASSGGTTRTAPVM